MISPIKRFHPFYHTSLSQTKRVHHNLQSLKFPKEVVDEDAKSTPLPVDTFSSLYFSCNKRPANSTQNENGSEKNNKTEKKIFRQNEKKFFERKNFK